MHLIHGAAYLRLSRSGSIQQGHDGTTTPYEFANNMKMIMCAILRLHEMNAQVLMKTHSSCQNPREGLYTSSLKESFGANR